MARRPRLHLPTAVYHVMLRGNDGQTIFFSDGDRSRMCLLLQQGVERFGHSVEAFCFMSNHIHLAVRVADISISQIMHHLAFRYTRYINRLYKRIGHLFQGRFKSIMVEDGDYLKDLIRYIHLNPVRAGMVSDPQYYRWSSHRPYMELDEFVWLSKDRVLKKFHLEKESALSNYEKYILKGIGVETEFDFKSGCENGMLGDSEFINETLTKTSLEIERKIELKDLITKVCQMHNLTPDELCSFGKHARLSRARALLALLVREINYLSLENLGQLLKRDPSGLTKLANRLEIKAFKDLQIAKDLQEIRLWLSEAKVGKMSECQA